jgi:acylglycerol lipase
MRNAASQVCCAVLCCAVLCCAVLCCAVLCCALLSIIHCNELLLSRMNSVTSSSHSFKSLILKLYNRLHPLVVPRESWLAYLLISIYLTKKLTSLANPKHNNTIITSSLDYSLFPNYLLNAQGLLLYHRWWLAPSAKCNIYIIHSYRAHSGRYESISRIFNSLGYNVFAIDLQGFGQSSGDRGYVESFDDYIEDCLLWIQYIQSNYNSNNSLPSFIMGQGMGAAIGLQILTAYKQIYCSNEKNSMNSANQCIPPIFHGCVLLSPAIIPPSSASALLQLVGNVLSNLLPKFGFARLADPSNISRIPAVYQQYMNDQLIYRGNDRARWGSEILSCMQSIRDNCASYSIPLLTLQGTADSSVDPSGARYLHDNIASVDKTLHMYNAAVNDLLMDECRELAYQHIHDWIEERLQKPWNYV